MENDLKSLRTLTDAIYPIPEEDWQAFAAIWKPVSAKRKEIITAAGETEKYLYFVAEGVSRVYFADDREREATLVFNYAPSFGGVIDSMLLQQPSRYYYETLTPCRFLRTTHTDLTVLMRARPEFETMIRQGITATLSGILERLTELQCFTSEEKFRKLLSRSPHILQLVPHKYLASYLGIDATNFSKLLNKVKL